MIILCNKNILRDHLLSDGHSISKILLTIKHQILRTAIGTRFDPPCASIFIDYTEKKSPKEQIQSWIWFRYIDDIFLIKTASGEEFDKFLSRLNIFHLNLIFTH